MCGRYRATSTSDDVAKLWKVPPNEAAEAAMERREVRPTTQIAVLQNADDGMTLEAVRWGIQPDWSRRPLLNARSDKLHGSRLWKRLAADHRHRCLFVADGWYEWLRPEQKTKDTKSQPFLHLLDGGRLFTMAGLLDIALVDGVETPAATVITTDAAGESARLSDRMPVVLPDLDRQRAWLDPSLTAADLDELCAPLADGVTIEPVTLGRR